MNRGSIFRRTVSILLAVSIMLFAAVSHAETKIYEGNGEYLMTDETVEFAKNQAELEAQRNVLDKICVYIKGISTMIDNELDEDEVVAISAGILHVIETKHSFESEVEGIVVKALVTAKIDIEELIRLLDIAIKNR